MGSNNLWELFIIFILFDGLIVSPDEHMIGTESESWTIFWFLFEQISHETLRYGGKHVWVIDVPVPFVLSLST